MRYRKFGKLDWQVSTLGFGCMRLPTVDGNPMSGNINEKESIQMIRTAIDHGVNYVDTAYPYHNGNSEVVLGKALLDGYRKKVKLATKSPVWLIKEPGDFDKYLDEQLKRLQTETVDFYLLHGLGHKTWNEVVLRFNLLERAESAIKEGKIGFLGFSFHDQYDAFPEITDGYDGWTFCQIQYNYMDIENQAGTKGLNYAATKGLAIVVMEPLLGGRLANPPQPVRAIFDSFPEKRSPADWALQWVWNHPEVSVLLSGMSAPEQVAENLRSAGNSAAGSFGDDERQLIDRVRRAFRERTPIPCTKCGYCLPCPSGVAIPRNFELYNNGIIYDDLEKTRSTYLRFVGENERANMCVRCRKCEEKCPQKIKISELLPKVHIVLGERK